MTGKEHIAGFFGYLGNLFLALASFKMKDVDLLIAIILKIITIISTTAITTYYIRKILKDIKNEKDAKKNTK